MTDEAQAPLNNLLESISIPELPQFRSEVVAEWLDQSLPAEVSTDPQVLQQQLTVALDTIEVHLGERLLILASLVERWEGGFSIAHRLDEDELSVERIFDGDNLEAASLMEAGEAILRLVADFRAEHGLARAEPEDAQ